MYSKVYVDKNMSDMFPIQNDLKQGDAFPPMEGPAAVYPVDVNLMGDHTDTTKKDTGILINISKDTDQEVNTEQVYVHVLSPK
jgi:hypothetical protein